MGMVFRTGTVFPWPIPFRGNWRKITCSGFAFAFFGVSLEGKHVSLSFTFCKAVGVSLEDKREPIKASVILLLDRMTHSMTSWQTRS